MVKRLATMQETWVQSLGQEYLLGKEIATHSSVLAWKIPWMEEPGYSLQTTVHGVAKSQTRLSDFTFTFIKRLFNSSSLSAIRVVSSVYLRLLTFLLAILIPACASSSPVFLMMYFAYKLNKQGDNKQP